MQWVVLVDNMLMILDFELKFFTYLLSRQVLQKKTFGLWLGRYVETMNEAHDVGSETRSDKSSIQKMS